MTLAPIQPIAFEPEAMQMAAIAGRMAAEIMPRSIQHAQGRSANIVLAEDVRAAINELLADIETLFHAWQGGTRIDVEFTDQDFEHISRLPYRRPDLADAADDDL